ncbi:MAG: cysteine hydrolase [Clostridiales bacterium]|nr:cysteine hydrolase [Clostridiales bacterium]
MGKKALIVVDMQNDFLWEKRKKMFNYDTEQLTANVNEAISTYKAEGCDIIYIKQYYQNIATNRLIIGFGIKGTEGAEIYSKINIVSDNIFVKYFPNTYTSKEFCRHMEKEGYDEVILCGVDECGCVGATAKGAVKTGVKVSLLKDCTGCRFPDSKEQKMRENLTKRGVNYINLK